MIEIVAIPRGDGGAELLGEPLSAAELGPEYMLVMPPGEPSTKQREPQQYEYDTLTHATLHDHRDVRGHLTRSVWRVVGVDR